MEKEILKMLKDTSEWEDSFIVKYDDETIWTLLRESLDEARFKKVRGLFMQNIDDSKKHSMMVKGLLAVREGGDG